MKLANGNLEQLQHCVDTAQKDYRDVLYWAEYPSCAAALDTGKLSGKEKAEISARDWEPYSKWLYG